MGNRFLTSGIYYVQPAEEQNWKTLQETEMAQREAEAAAENEAESTVRRDAETATTRNHSSGATETAGVIDLRDQEAEIEKGVISGVEETVTEIGKEVKGTEIVIEKGVKATGIETAKERGLIDLEMRTEKEGIRKEIETWIEIHVIEKPKRIKTKKSVEMSNKS